MSLESWDIRGLSFTQKLINTFSEHLFCLCNRAKQARMLMDKKELSLTHRKRTCGTFGDRPHLAKMLWFLGSSSGARTPSLSEMAWVQGSGRNSCLEKREEAGSDNRACIFLSLYGLGWGRAVGGQEPRVLPTTHALQEQWREVHPLEHEFRLLSNFTDAG